MKISILLCGILCAASYAAPVAEESTQLLDSRNSMTTLKDRYFTNWAGVIMHPLPGGESYNVISGQFTMPTLRLPAASSGLHNATYSGSTWVALSGSGFILQTGVYWEGNKAEDGSIIFEYVPWWEWLPGPAIGIDRAAFSVKAGDKIELTAKLVDSKHGRFILNNLSTRQVFDKTVGLPDNPPNPEMIGENAEWIVESFIIAKNGHDLIDFGAVDYTNCQIGTTGQAQPSWGDTDLISMIKGNTVIAIPTIDAAKDSIHISYVGQ